MAKVRRWTKEGDRVPIIPHRWGKGMDTQVFIDPDGNRHEFLLYAGTPAARVLAVSEDGQVIGVREYMQGQDDIILGGPGGGPKSGETYEDCVRREVLEETGYQVGRLIDLDSGYIDPRSSANYLRLFLALDCKPVKQQELDDAEGDIEVVLIPIKTWIGIVENGEENIDPFTTTVTFRALKHLGYKIVRTGD